MKFENINYRLSLKRSFLIFVIVFISIFTYNWYYNKNNIIEFNTNILKNGDIILIHGNTFRSKIVYKLTQNEEEFSHVGIVFIGDEDILLIHASPENEKIYNKVVSEKILIFFKEWWERSDLF